MSSIFCLETEWDQTVHDMKKDSSVYHLLQYLGSMDIEFVFRQVATKSDFEYYLSHLIRPSYERFDIIYLCFHGYPGAITFANKETMTLEDISKNYPGIFKNRKVHFGACNTLNVAVRSIEEFKRVSEAKLVTGYARTVDFHDSFLLELWFLHILATHKSVGPIKLSSKVEKEVKYFKERLKFMIY